MKVSVFIPFLSLFSTQIYCLYEDDFKVLNISDGKIRGRQLTTYKNTKYYAFQDIPYAKPPLANLRLMDPQLPEKWIGILNTTSNSKVCYQFQSSHDDPRETEDCLILSVYTPVKEFEQKEKLAVLVWIHGGSFSTWSGSDDSFGPHYFIDQKLVVVTMNYRLGPLGFLSTGDGVFPENVGLKDQHLALKWVNQNIEKFGGDPSKVTIVGQSAGAVSVGYHLLNENSKGLFRAAIMQSGTPLVCWALQKNEKNVAEGLGHFFSSDPSSNFSSQDIFDLVKTADINTLKNFTNTYMNTRFNMSGINNCHQYTSTLMAPVVDEGRSSNPFITGLNHEKIKNGNINRVPILIGINSEEMLLFGLSALGYQASLFDATLSEAISENLLIQNSSKAAAGKVIRDLYTNYTFESTASGSIQMFNDMMFATPTARHAILQSKYTDVFYYQFSYHGTLGRLVYNDIDGAAGVAHQEEVSYFWHNSTDGDLSQYPREDIFVHKRAVELWSQFVKHLNPTAEKSVLIGNITWPSVTPEQFVYLDINSNLTVINHPIRKYLDYSKIYSEYAKNELDTY